MLQAWPLFDSYVSRIRVQIRAGTDDDSELFFQNDRVKFSQRSTAQGQSILRRVFDEAFNQGDLAVIDELIASESISHHVSWGVPANRMGFKQLIAMLRTAFPDLSCTVEDEINQD